MAYIFFLSFYFLGCFFLLSLFVAVIADCFHTCNAMKGLDMEQDVFDHYGQVWLDFTKGSKPVHKWLHTFQLKPFLIALGEPLGLSERDLADR